MIQCTITRPDTGRVICTIKGHARYAPVGKDIVCAGVSALYQSLKLGLQEYEPAFKDQIEGFEIQNPTKIGAALVCTFIKSMECIEKTFPKYVSLCVL